MCAPLPIRASGLADKIRDPPDLVYALTTQILDKGQRLVRYRGWYSNRSRSLALWFDMPKARSADDEARPRFGRTLLDDARSPAPTDLQKWNHLSIA